MRRLAILIPGVATHAFYSQLAAFTRALLALPWRRWEPTVHFYLGGPEDFSTLERWLPHLREAELIRCSAARYEQYGDWAQGDDRFNLAPHDADLLLAADADMLPVAPFEEVLDSVHAQNALAGVIAHYPFPTEGSLAAREAWARAAEGHVDTPLAFDFDYSLMESDALGGTKVPFYLNFGAVFAARGAYDVWVRRYLEIRPQLAERGVDPRFAGQVALTLAAAATGVQTRALPMRFNFANDDVAAQMYPDELADVRLYHYLRTGNFDRHVIFASEQEYDRFMALPLEGVDRAFRDSVRAIFGDTYPFG